MRELDGLKSRPSLGSAAREATKTVHSFLSMEQENSLGNMDNSRKQQQQLQWLELQLPLERNRNNYFKSADEEVLRACEAEMRRHPQVILITDDVNLQARALSRRIPTDSLRSFSNAVNAFYSNYSKYSDGTHAQVRMRDGHIALSV